MKTLHYSIIAILAFTVIMIIIVFPLYHGYGALIVDSRPYQENVDGNGVTNSSVIPPQGIPASTGIMLHFNDTKSWGDTFYFKQGQNVTLVVSATSNPTNLPLTLYAEPHIGFTSTNGLDFKFSSTHLTTPGTVLLYISVGKDATPNAYRTNVFATTEGEPGSVTMGGYLGITVIQDNSTQKLQNTSISNTGVTSMSVHVANTNFTVNYTIDSGKVLGIAYDKQTKSVMASVKTTSKGVFTVTLPRALVDSVLPNGKDDRYVILINDTEATYNETNITATNRTLSIPILQGTSAIEIIGEHVI